jgi:hypothetical protein
MEAIAAINRNERNPLNAESVGRLRLGGIGGGGAAAGCNASLGLCGVALWPANRPPGWISSRTV